PEGRDRSIGTAGAGAQRRPHLRERPSSDDNAAQTARPKWGSGGTRPYHLAGASVLIRLLRAHLRPYRRALMAIVVLQTVQTSAALTLPTLNARIIDNGVIPGDVDYIKSQGALMLFFALVQVTFAVAAVYYGGKVAMSFGR